LKLGRATARWFRRALFLPEIAGPFPPRAPLLLQLKPFSSAAETPPKGARRSLRLCPLGRCTPLGQGPGRMAGPGKVQTRRSGRGPDPVLDSQTEAKMTKAYVLAAMAATLLGATAALAAAPTAVDSTGDSRPAVDRPADGADGNLVYRGKKPY
jgi:hypothetical protein